MQNNNKDHKRSGLRALGGIKTNFYQLNEASIKNIADTYGMNFYLALTEQNLSFPRIFSYGESSLNKID